MCLNESQQRKSATQPFLDHIINSRGSLHNAITRAYLVRVNATAIAVLVAGNKFALSSKLASKESSANVHPYHMFPNRFNIHIQLLVTFHVNI